MKTFVDLIEPPRSKEIYFWPDEAEIHTLAHSTQTLTHIQFFPFERIFYEKPLVPIEIHLQTTRDQIKISTSSFS